MDNEYDVIDAEIVEQGGEGDKPDCKPRKPRKPYQAYTSRPMPIKWQCIVDRLPEFKWNITQTALAVGYAPAYVDTKLIPALRKDDRFNAAVARKRDEVCAGAWTIEGWRKLAVKLLADCEAAGDRTNTKETIRMIAQHIGAFEADNRQKQPQIGMVIM